MTVSESSQPSGMRPRAERMAHIAAFEVMEIQTRARQLETLGHDVIHLEIGEPDFATPQPVLDAAKQALDHERMGYTSALGLLRLREAIAAFYQTQYGVSVDSQRIIVTAGSSAALLLTFGVLLNPGDQVLMADPGYPCNRHFVRALDGVPQSVAVDSTTDYQITAAHIAQHWQPRTTAALVATPSNPTGTVINQESLAAIGHAVGERHGAFIVDEIYQGLTYGVKPLTALASAAVADNVFVINSFSKYFQMTGWRLGWLVAPIDYVRDIEKLAQNLFISPSAPAQHAALAAFRPETLSLLEARRRELQQRRDYLVPALESIGFRIPVVPMGAFYIYADSSQIATDSVVLCRRLLEEAKVAITPGKDFGTSAPEKYVRIAYTQPITRLQEAVLRIQRMLRS